MKIGVIVAMVVVEEIIIVIIRMMIMMMIRKSEIRPHYEQQEKLRTHLQNFIAN